MIIELMRGRVYGLCNVPQRALNTVLRYDPTFMESVISHDGAYTNDADIDIDQLPRLEAELRTMGVEFARAIISAVEL